MLAVLTSDLQMFLPIKVLAIILLTWRAFCSQDIPGKFQMIYERNSLGTPLKHMKVEAKN